MLRNGELTWIQIGFDMPGNDQSVEHDPDLSTNNMYRFDPSPNSPATSINSPATGSKSSTTSLTSAEKRELQLTVLSRVNEQIQEAMVPWKRYIQALQNSLQDDRDGGCTLDALRIKSEAAWRRLKDALESSCGKIRGTYHQAVQS